LSLLENFTLFIGTVSSIYEWFYGHIRVVLVLLSLRLGLVIVSPCLRFRSGHSIILKWFKYHISDITKRDPAVQYNSDTIVVGLFYLGDVVVDTLLTKYYGQCHKMSQRERLSM